MAQKKNNYTQEKRAAKKAAKAIKKSKHPILITIAIILVIAIAVGLYWYFFVYKKKQPDPIQTGDLSITFFELGNKYVGDCTLIKVGNTEVLIDAGSKQNSADTLVPEIKKLCTDGKLEYVIATHAHEDHIGAFYSTSSRPGIFESFECGTIIDFPLTRKEYSASSVYGRYVDSRKAEVEAGAVHYTALQCWNETDGAKRSYQLSDDITLNILYQKYYEEYDSSKSAENNYSVCAMVTQGTYNYLFTGDLEKEGEESLVEKNSLPHCKLFKGGHHGSSTSSTDKLLSVIQPETICICTCAGTPEYAKTNPAAFPTQECINRMAVYTDQIFVTSLATGVDWETCKWDGIVSMNGIITVVSDGVKFSVTGSNNSTILKETEWFKENRTWPSNGK
ncbi:MAG: MBL fold metallo-hydrolase [Clostridiales bacterium]|nr:MBL fold metallo-hydrolase [Clostridiales bacterium]